MLCLLCRSKRRSLFNGKQIGGSMVDYSEILLSINKSMQEVHKLLLAGNKDAAESYLKAVSASAEMLAAWLHQNK